MKAKFDEVEGMGKRLSNYNDGFYDIEERIRQRYYYYHLLLLILSNDKGFVSDGVMLMSSLSFLKK